ncbi:MAG TPA: MFS transporter [Spirochaetota bacterium]|nr:MFS transporter [Spirochaetota bacterium]
MHDTHSGGTNGVLNTNLVILFSVTLMAVMGVSIVTPAHPMIVRDLGISTSQIGLLITVFAFPGILLTPVLGILADRLGRRKILVPSLFVFGVFGSACAFTKDFGLLLVLRFLQGAGAAALGSINLTIIGDLYSGRERATAMGYNASVLSIGTASYPAIGGAVAVLGWQYPFLFSLIAIPIGILVIMRVKNPEPVSTQEFGEYMSHTLRLISTREMRGLFLASLSCFIMIYGPYLTYFPFLAERHISHSPVVIGLFMSFTSVSTALTSLFLGRLARRFTERTLIKTAFMLYAATMLLLASTGSVPLIAAALVLAGIAGGISIPAVQSVIAGLAPIEQRGAFMSVNGMVIRMGQAFGPLVAAFAYGVWGLNGTFHAGSALSLAVMGLLIVLIPGSPARESA